MPLPHPMLECLSGLSLHKSCAGCHTCWEFKSAAAPLSPETLWFKSFITSSFPPLLLRSSLNRQGCVRVEGRGGGRASISHLGLSPLQSLIPCAQTTVTIISHADHSHCHLLPASYSSVFPSPTISSSNSYLFISFRDTLSLTPAVCVTGTICWSLTGSKVGTRK